LDTKRLVIALMLSAAVLILWTVLFPPPAPPKPAAGAVAAPTAPAAGTSTAAAPAPTAAAAPAPERPAPVVAAPIAAQTETLLTVESGLYRATVTNRGGALRAFTLKAYRDSEGHPLDLVQQSPGFPGLTLTLDPAEPFLARAAQALFTIEKEEKNATVTLRYRYREGDGSGLVRTYVFRSGYVASMRVEREGPGRPAIGIVAGPGIGNPSPEEMKSQYTRPGSAVVLFGTGSVTRKANGGLKEAEGVGPGLTAVGLEDNYFLAAFLPDARTTARIRPEAVSTPAGPDGKSTPSEIAVVLEGTGVLAADLFLGPKDIDILEKVRPGMDKLIDYGWFAILVKPLLWTLKAIQEVVVNWGVAILVITFLIKILLYPLTHKQLVSMKKMSALQPKMEAIRAKYATKTKSDPQARLKMNEETMALYKQEGVNPAGGCLPLLLQMPILIAFYNLLAHAIELRHAPFMLWITDLSAKDPYYVTPILMTVTMWLQQQMTPATGDPAMRRMMNIMPFAMGFFFKDMPSGLVLYWLMQNVLTIVQQIILNRYTDLGPTSMKKARARPG
jgi:YidC/Oxa1 family membrane protein insertase